jgi:mannose/fructose-specific phosphotransferase system component IIA
MPVSGDGVGGRFRGVVIGHGDMARGMVDAVRTISGASEEVLVPLSNAGRSPEILRKELDALLEKGPTVVFTDLQAGSCALAAVAASHKGEAVVICGANLPMLLDFVFQQETSLEALAERLVARGREGIRSLTPKAAGAGPRSDSGA